MEHKKLHVATLHKHFAIELSYAIHFNLLQALLRRSFSGDRCIRPRSSIAALGSDLQFVTTGEDNFPSPSGQPVTSVILKSAWSFLHNNIFTEYTNIKGTCS